MEAIWNLDSEIEFEIFTQVPRWFFEDSLLGSYEYHSVFTDIGLVQTTPLQIDLSGTLKRLNNLLPFNPPKIKKLVDIVKERRCQLIVSDIAPMGIAVAKEAGVPSVLVENFTWDWIYQEYVTHDGQLIEHIHYLRGLFDDADYHIQTEPVCQPQSPDLIAFPVSREVRTPAREIRKRLGMPENTKVVMVTMGGINERYPFLEKLGSIQGIGFIIPGAAEEIEVHGNLWLLPHHSGFFHPDLVNSCDVVIGKVGYSTLAEVYYAGLPFGYIARRRFRESQILVSFIENQMNGLPIDEDRFYRGDWISYLPDLLAMPRIHRQCPHGATQVARFIYGLLP